MRWLRTGSSSRLSPKRESHDNDDAGPPEHIAQCLVYRRYAAKRRVGEQASHGGVAAFGFSDNATVRVTHSQPALIRGPDDAEALFDATENGHPSVILAVNCEVPCRREHRLDPCATVPSSESRKPKVFADGDAEAMSIHFNDRIAIARTKSHFDQGHEVLFRVLEHEIAVAIEEPGDVVPMVCLDDSDARHDTAVMIPSP